MLSLRDILVRPVMANEEIRFQELMQAHHYLGALPKIGETLWYVAVWREEWVALLCFSAAALKCAARDRWIGWNFRHQYGRLNWLTNNSRFLILPDWHYPNLGSRTLALCERRLSSDWQLRFGHPVVLLETFVDPQRFHGTVYRAANWHLAGDTRGFRRIRGGYSSTAQSSKWVFLKSLRPDAQAFLAQPILDSSVLNLGTQKMMLSADHMRALPDFFADIDDPRRAQGQRHRLDTLLALAAGATLCGMRGYKAMADWVESLGQKARERFGCRWHKGQYLVPSEYVLRDILIRVDPQQLDHALQRWNEVYGPQDQSLAIDGKTMCNALDVEGYQTHIMSVVGHDSATCYAQKK